MLESAEPGLDLVKSKKPRLPWFRVNPNFTLAVLLAAGVTLGTACKLSSMDDPISSPPEDQRDKALTPRPTSIPVDTIVYPDLPTAPVDSERKQLQDYLDRYLKGDLAKDFAPNAQTSWTVLQAPIFAVKKVTTRAGLLGRDFPDAKSSRSFPGGFDNGPWPYATVIPGVASKLVLEYNQATGELQVWMVRFGSKGGFPGQPKNFPVFFRIADSDSLEGGGEFVRVEVERDNGDVEQITVAELVRNSYPKIDTLPYSVVSGVVK